MMAAVGTRNLGRKSASRETGIEVKDREQGKYSTCLSHGILKYAVLWKLSIEPSSSKEVLRNQEICETGTDARRLDSVLNNLTGKRSATKLLDGLLDMDKANNFMRHFDEKIKNIVNNLKGAKQFWDVVNE
ncbi:hypothetical protein E2C01_040530 [Portunus trituberculatus]|uniref:Uncharacterized protein n=1 Tax=Portunus trituberculatus TaxID=210409 RepID=A0A5B7FJX7_PORTR|nr:hypothetical protein [Portunus trituberculatus]